MDLNMYTRGRRNTFGKMEKLTTQINSLIFPENPRNCSMRSISAAVTTIKNPRRIKLKIHPYVIL